MTLGQITPEAVSVSMSEARALGRGPFLKENGFGLATTYLLVHEGEFYDPKAIIGVAHGHVPGLEALTPREFDATEAVNRLRQLGYLIVDFSGLWWVNQGATYNAERDGGYVWAPQTNKAGQQVAHHVAVNRLRVGEKIVHYARGSIRAIGTVAEPPSPHSKPQELGGEWGELGYLCRVVYKELGTPLAKDEIPHRTVDVGPFDVNGNVKQAYMTKVNDAELFPMLEFLYSREPELFDRVDAEALPDLRPGHVQDEVPMSHPLVELLRNAKNVVLEGVPGTGKTFAIESIAANWHAATGRPLLQFDGQRFAVAVMHPSTSYEDFIEGLRPSIRADSTAPFTFDQAVPGSGKFRLDDGFFLRACQLAVRNPHCDLLVLLDEFNRCNISSVLGDLLLSLEASKRARFRGSNGEDPNASHWDASVRVSLPYSRRIFFVPDNVYVVATTNTSDRSVAPLDAAIRRRFSFVRLEPDFADLRSRANEAPPSVADHLVTSIELVESLNETLGSCVGPDSMLGQSYLYLLLARLQQAAADNHRAIVREVWEYQVVPQLVESLRAHGAEDLLDSTARSRWLNDHHLEAVSIAAKATMERLDEFLRAQGLVVAVAGTGLARGARLLMAPAVTRTRVDIAYEDAALEAELDADGAVESVEA